MKRVVEICPVTGVAAIDLPAQSKAYRVWAAFCEVELSDEGPLVLQCGQLIDGAIAPIWEIPQPHLLLSGSNYRCTWIDGGVASVPVTNGYGATGQIDPVTGDLETVVITEQNAPAVLSVGLPRFVVSPSMRVRILPSPQAGTITVLQARFYVDFVDERTDLGA